MGISCSPPKGDAALSKTAHDHDGLYGRHFECGTRVPHHCRNRSNAALRRRIMQHIDAGSLVAEGGRTRHWRAKMPQVPILPGKYLPVPILPGKYAEVNI